LYERVVESAEATSGHVNYRLGVMYDHGYYITRDRETANQYFHLALEQLTVSVAQGDSEACCDLGYMYDCGCFVNKNAEMAFQYYKLAADKGLQRAQFNLGLLYDQGVGVSVDIVKSLYYFRCAAAQGYVNALFHLASLYKRGYKNEVQKDLAIAFNYYKQAADAGYSPASFQIADIYSSGNGVRSDIKLAIKYYLKAAPQHTDATERVINCFTSADKFVRKEAATYLSETWPDSHYMLNKRCGEGVVMLFGMRKDMGEELGLNVPVELIVLIAKELIVIWPDYHYELKSATRIKEGKC